jgi:hypothetical protein
MKRLILLAASFILLIHCIAYPADKKPWPLDIERYRTVTLKIPAALIGFEKINAWRGTTNYTAYIQGLAGGKVAVNTRSDWRAAGWPLMRNLRLEKVEQKSDYTEVELRQGGENVKLRFQGVKDLNAAFAQVVYPGNTESFESSDYYKTEVIDRFLPTIFKGRLATIHFETQMLLLKGANYDLNFVGGEEYKGKFYVVLRDTTADVYNTLQLNQAARVSRVTEGTILTALRGTYKLIGGIEEIDGVKIEMRVLYKDFVNEHYSAPHADDLHAYVPFSLIQEFDEAEITNQDLVDRSIFLVNGNRVKVSLTQFN